MRPWKKGLLGAALALAVLLLAPAFGSAPNVNLMAVNDTILTTTTENMPRTVGGVLYVPYTMLSKRANDINLGVNAMYSTTRREVVVSDGQRGVVFDTQANTAQDLEGNPVPARAMVRNSTVFIPIDWLCGYFGTISCARIRTAYGTLIRVTNSAAILSGQELVNAADSLLADSLNHYYATGGREEGETPAPSDEPRATEAPTEAELYLALRWGGEARECAQLLESRGLRALFLFTPEELEENDGLIRRLAGAGHTLGLVLEGGNGEDCLTQGERGRQSLASIARYNALVAEAPEADEEGRRALEEAGYVLWRATILGEDFSSGGTLVRALDGRRVNYVEIACGSGGANFLRSALSAMEEERCRIYQAAAPALSAG